MNILWIGMDQLRYDTPACNGNTVCRTPNLDRIASRGVSFDRAYSPSSLCSPARASMLTGQFAFHHGLITNCDLYHAPAAEIARPDELLHYRLLEAGYRCGFVGKSHIGANKAPQDYGFDGFSPAGYGDIRNQQRYRQYLQKNNLTYTIRDTVYANPDKTTCLGGIWDGPTESTPAYFLAEETINRLEEYAGASAPFFLTCQFWGPHQAHLPSREFAGMHDRAAMEPWPNFADEWQGKPEMIQRVHRDFYRARPSGWEQWREVVGLYYDVTAMIDAQVGRILDRLETLGCTDNTIVVFSTDHGDMTGSHGGMLDKGYPYEEAHHIPLMVTGPGRFEENCRSQAMVYNMDIFPTLLDAAGLEVPERDGRSFLDVLEGGSGDNTRDEVYLEFHGLRFLYSQRAIVTGDNWKYVFSPGDFDEVYDLDNDPAELHNLIKNEEYAERVEELRQRLMNAAAAAKDPLMPCIWKYFGNWNPPGSPFDATRLSTGEDKTGTM